MMYDAYIFFEETITIPNKAAAGAAANNANEKVIFKIALHLLIASVQKTIVKYILSKTLVQ